MLKKKKIKNGMNEKTKKKKKRINAGLKLELLKSVSAVLLTYALPFSTLFYASISLHMLFSYPNELPHTCSESSICPCLPQL